jgi:hypothetical protein
MSTKLNKFDTVANIIGKYSFNLIKLLDHILEDPNSNLYIHIKANGKDIHKSAFLTLPKQLIFDIKTEQLKTGEFKKINVNFLHTNITKPDAHLGYVFLMFDELESMDKRYMPHQYDKHTQYYHIFDSFKSTTKLEHHPMWSSFHNKYFTLSQELISKENIFVKLDNKLMKKLEASIQAQTLDEYSLADRKKIAELVSLVGMEQIKDLSLILDPNWSGYSTEVIAMFKLQSSIIIKNSGNTSDTFRQRMSKSLSKYNLPTALNNRLITIATPDKDRKAADIKKLKILNEFIK